ncbi:acyl-CoA synthetase [Chondromyces apiculatus]|uniref:Long-chain-fatty-acid--CoA ligase n=1 Tax=Chondromyces apiculatus DSM 436 TaxID=1192034 RepID=A0A017SX76_9BACT|nr:long-chain fatty acid--CoA ligase [Chondromyces apiculatus]EYF01554.1 Long-chain-fatty-acid--CoA ligase [Chondromyces apiculatus DSM 436]
MYIGDWMERGERYWPDALAVVDVAKGDAGRLSYRQMNRRANRLARWLKEVAGVRRGDRVAILALNGVEFLDLLFACGKLGAVFVPFNWRSHPRELIDLFAKTTPVVLLFGDDFRAAAAAVLQEAPSVTHALHLDGPGLSGEGAGQAGEGSRGPMRSLSYEEALSSVDDGPVSNEAVDAEDVLLLLFTGGTTGLPKAAQISYRMIAWNTLNTIVHELQRGDVTITHTPKFHTGGLLVYTLPLLTLGGTVVIMRRWTPEEMLDLIERERVSLLFCVPTQFQVMMEAPRFATTSFKSVRFLTSGGAPLPVQIIHRYREQHGVVFKQGFGMTEFGPGIFSMSPEFAESKAGSIGRPNYFVDARIVDENNEPVGAGEVGELVLKGPAASSGYFNDPEATRNAVDGDGWFHTGDMARADSDGFYYIADRKKDMFISGGENVYPVEIEKALYEHAAVAQCAVIGVPDDKWGEVGMAVVVLRQGAAATEDALIAHCRERLARYKVPKSVVFLPELPLSAAGKILKRELRSRFA